ncbi:MAG TPA: protein kinase [Longimicrobiales bacterium]|nr:protein kinase [Longimicrobiales bacterium]
MPTEPPALSGGQWARARTLFHGALRVPPHERIAWLECHCGADRELRSAVEAMLQADATSHRVLDASLGDLSRLLVHEEGVPAVRPGDRVGPYRILAELGRGGMGVVYKAEDTRLARFVALKFLPGSADDEHRVDRLLAEARALAALDHPNIATLYEVDVGPDGRWFMAMAYYEGETLARRLEAGALSREEAVRIACGIARGLAAAHDHGVVHHDVKPGNVVIRVDGEPLLVDFGIAGLVGRTGGGSRSGQGTVAYMSPERVAGEPADARADVWALGVVLYEMLAGRRPFAGETTDEVLAQIQAAVPPLLPPRVGRDLDRVVRRALARDPTARFIDAREMCLRLERCAGRRRRPPRRVILIAVAGLGATALALADRPRSSDDDTVPDVGTRSPLAYRLYDGGLRQLAQGAKADAYASFVSALREDTSFAMAAFHAWRLFPADSLQSLALALAGQAPERERLFVLGFIEGVGRRSPTALGYSDSLSTRHPRGVLDDLLAATLLAERGDYAAAVRKAREVERVTSGARGSSGRQWQERHAADLVVRAYWSMDSLPAAEREARRILALDPGDQAMRDALAKVLDRQGRAAEAHSLLSTLQSQWPGRHHPWEVDLALLAIRRGDLESAERDLATLSHERNEGDRAFARHYRFVALRTQGRPGAALAIALEGRLPEDRRPEYVSAGAGTLHEGIARFEIGEADRAAAIFDALAAAAPEDRPDRTAWWLTHSATAVAALGDTARLRRLADSVQTFGARSLFGRDPKLHHYARGLLEVARGRDTAAVGHFETAFVSPNEGFTRVNYEMGRALMRLGRPGEAIPIVSAALRGSLDASNFYVTHTELHELLAQAHDAAGQADSARVHYRWVVDAWTRAEPPFQPRRAEAARRLAALGG